MASPYILSATIAGIALALSIYFKTKWGKSLNPTTQTAGAPKKK
jgi:hypothetical protein